MVRDATADEVEVLGQVQVTGRRPADPARPDDGPAEPTAHAPADGREPRASICMAPASQPRLRSSPRPRQRGAEPAASCRRTSSIVSRTAIVSASGRSGCSSRPSAIASPTARNIGT